MSRFQGLEIKLVSINTLMQFAVRLIGSITTLTTTLLITYFLGLDAVGSFTKVIAFVSIFYLFLDFGFNSILLKNYFKSVESQIGNLVALRLIIALLLIPIIAFLAFLLPVNEIAKTGFSGVEKLAIVVYSLTLVGVAINNTLQAFLQRRMAYSLSVYPTFVANVILIAIVLFAVYSSNLFLLFSAYIFSGTINAVLLYTRLKNKFKIRLTLKHFSTFSKDIFSSSWPLAIMLLFNFTYARADIFILSFLKPNSDVGTYGISYRFFEIALALPAFLANSTYPLLLSKAHDHKNYFLIFKKYLRIYTILSLICMIGIIVLSPLIGFLGRGLQLSIIPLQLLSLSLPFFFLTSILQWHFIINNRLVFLVPLYGGMLIINILLNVLFIPEYSYYASALITGFTEALVLILMLWYFYHTTRKSVNR